MKVRLTEKQDYCDKCGAPLGKKTRFVRRRAWLVTLSPDLHAFREYELCMDCITKIEAWVEHRTEGRIRIVQPKESGQLKLED